MNTFIEAFKKTSYYRTLFNVSTDILAIYLLGSMSTGIIDEDSDYDIVILTLDGKYLDTSKYEYLIYKGRTVHWYYKPVKDLFKAEHACVMRYIGMMQVRNIRKDLIIYENPKYQKALQRLYEMKDIVSVAGMYSLFTSKKPLIDDILTEDKILKKHYTKLLYHLCLASLYLTQEPLAKSFLKELKQIRTKPISAECECFAIKRLKIYKAYIEDNAGVSQAELYDMYTRCMQCE